MDPGVTGVASPALIEDIRGLCDVRAAAVSLATEAEIVCDSEAVKDCSKGLGSKSSLLRSATTAGVRRSASGSDEARMKRETGDHS
jgi:hypothetical protein